jgi:hypothetical protein
MCGKTSAQTRRLQPVARVSNDPQTRRSRPAESQSEPGTTFGRMRDRETIASELRLVTTLRRAAREPGGPLPSVDLAYELLDERNGAVHLQ